MIEDAALVPTLGDYQRQSSMCRASSASGHVNLRQRELPGKSRATTLTHRPLAQRESRQGIDGLNRSGRPGHLLALLLQEKTGTRFNLVPYRGVNPSVQDLIAGQIDMTISNTATAMPHVRAGRVKAFAVTTKDRIAIAPEIPSAEEAGFPWLQFSLWAGLFAPKGTPRDIIDKLNAAAVGTTHDPAMRQKLVDQGFVIPPRERQTSEALGAYQKAEIAKWWPIIKAAGTKAE
jgi:tripartite-type tricarboxylate transporter receptor subunit TctC